MAPHTWLSAPTIVTALVTFCATANAQVVPTTSMAEASRRLATGHRVEIVTTDGSVIIGRLVRASASGLVVEAKGKTVDFEASGIDQVIARGDPIRDGVRKGTLIGAVSAAGVGFGLSAAFGEDKPGDSNDAAGVFALLGIGAGIGAGLGAAFDVIRDDRTMVFKAESRQTVLAPVIGRDRKGVALIVRF
jgi:hypothetical protein